jgi:two-component system, LytTR family, response regulator
MINAILIDDEKHCLVTLRMMLNRYCKDVHVIEECSSAKKGLEAIAKHRPDLIFLDIEMPIMNGFELLQRLPEIPFAVIFTTSYDQYAIKAIKFSALDYLLKPIDPEELITAVSKVSSRKQLPGAEQFDILLNQIRQKGAGFEKIAIPTMEGFELIRADQIIRCEADDNYTHVFLKNKTRIVSSRMLKEMEELLQEFRYFERVHNSYLVNMNEVSKYVRGDGGYLLMSDGSTVSISKSRRESLIKWFV